MKISEALEKAGFDLDNFVMQNYPDGQGGAYVPNIKIIATGGQIDVQDKYYLKCKTIGLKVHKLPNKAGIRVLNSPDTVSIIIDLDDNKSVRFSSLFKADNKIKVGNFDITGALPLINDNKLTSDLMSAFENIHAERIVGFNQIDFSKKLYLCNIFNKAVIGEGLDVSAMASARGLREFSLMFNGATLGSVDLTQYKVPTRGGTSIDNLFKNCHIDNIDMHCMVFDQLKYSESFAERAHVGEFNMDSVVMHPLRNDPATLKNMFRGASIDRLYFDGVELNGISKTAGMFFASKIYEMSISQLSIPDLEDATEMFANAQIEQINEWEYVGNIGVGRAVNCTGMFKFCRTAYVNLSTFFQNIGYISCANEMFADCKIGTLDISGLDFSSVSGASHLFDNAVIGTLIARGTNIDLDDGGIEYTLSKYRTKIGKLIT